jgi:8-oxo-dGTP diphosphatase
MASGLIQRVLIPHFRVGVVGIIIDERKHVLLLKHTYRDRHPWGLPTGFLEGSEQPGHALIREIEEECALQVALDGVWHVYTETERPLVSIVFTGTFVGGEVMPSVEVSSAAFFSLDELPDMLPDQRRILLSWDTGERS